MLPFKEEEDEKSNKIINGKHREFSNTLMKHGGKIMTFHFGIILV